MLLSEDEVIVIIVLVVVVLLVGDDEEVVEAAMDVLVVIFFEFFGLYLSLCGCRVIRLLILQMVGHDLHMVFKSDGALVDLYQILGHIVLFQEPCDIFTLLDKREAW